MSNSSARLVWPLSETKCRSLTPPTLAAVEGVLAAFWRSLECGHLFVPLSCPGRRGQGGLALHWVAAFIMHTTVGGQNPAALSNYENH